MRFVKHFEEQEKYLINEAEKESSSHSQENKKNQTPSGETLQKGGTTLPVTEYAHSELKLDLLPKGSSDAKTFLMKMPNMYSSEENNVSHKNLEQILVTQSPSHLNNQVSNFNAASMHSIEGSFSESFRNEERENIGEIYNFQVSTSNFYKKRKSNQNFLSVANEQRGMISNSGTSQEDYPLSIGYAFSDKKLKGSESWVLGSNFLSYI